MGNVEDARPEDHYYRRFMMLEEQMEFDETNVVDQFLEDQVLNEGKAKSKTIKLSKMSQINRAAGRAALQLAKNANDPLYTKYKTWRNKALDLKKKLMKKYGKKGKKVAKKSLM